MGAYLTEVVFLWHSTSSKQPSLKIAPNAITEYPPRFTDACNLLMSNY